MRHQRLGRIPMKTYRNSGLGGAWPTNMFCSPVSNPSTGVGYQWTETQSVRLYTQQQRFFCSGISDHIAWVGWQWNTHRSSGLGSGIQPQRLETQALGLNAQHFPDIRPQRLGRTPVKYIQKLKPLYRIILITICVLWDPAPGLGSDANETHLQKLKPCCWISPPKMFKFLLAFQWCPTQVLGSGITKKQYCVCWVFKAKARVSADVSLRSDPIAWLGLGIRGNLNRFCFCIGCSHPSSDFKCFTCIRPKG